MHLIYDKALAVLKSDKFMFAALGAKQAKLEFLNPMLQNRMKDYKPESEDIARW